MGYTQIYVTRQIFIENNVYKKNMKNRDFIYNVQLQYTWIVVCKYTTYLHNG